MFTKNPLTPDQALREPSLHPEAAPLLHAVAQLLGEQGSCVLYVGFLRLERWAATQREIFPGVNVQWHGRLVLLGTLSGEVWLYSPNADWEKALQAMMPSLPPGAPVIDASTAMMQESSLQPMSPDVSCIGPAMPPMMPCWTGGEQIGRIVDRPGEQQAVIDASTISFRHLLGYQRQRADGAR